MDPEDGALFIREGLQFSEVVDWENRADEYGTVATEIDYPRAREAFGTMERLARKYAGGTLCKR